MKKRVIIVLSAAMFLFITVRGLQSQPASQAAKPAAPQKTVWDGVYTPAQAARGQAAYEANCARCHGNTLGTNTPSLVGNDFMDRWREDNVQSLFEFVRTSMPPRRGRGANAERVQLADELYIDIIGYVMQANAFPPGQQELKSGSLEPIQIQGKDGPRPLPNGALAKTVGCLMRVNPTTWTLSSASEPTRTRSENATAEELKAAEGIGRGTLSFRLQNMGYLGADFNPDVHDGHRVQVKGMLIRQPNAERIDVRSIAMVADSCSN